MKLQKCIRTKLYTMVMVTMSLMIGITALQAQCTLPMPKDKILMNTSGSGNVIIHDYDVVAYVVSNKSVKGQSSFAIYYNNAVYRFSTLENKEVFRKEPVKYASGFGGYCPVAASMGEVEDIENEQFDVYQGKLYLFMNKKAKGMWEKDKAAILTKATTNWPCLTEKAGKKLK